MKDRPLQPGGEVLPGATPAERDFAFLRGLGAVVPSLVAGRIETEEEALRARDELLRIDLTHLPIGIEFNRLSEDGFHGAEHRTIAQWIPDVPIQFRDESELFAAQDRYLTDPNDLSLRTLDATVQRLMEMPTNPGELLAAHKYRSLLILQHWLRTGHLVRPESKGTAPNPFWSIGDLARFYADEGSLDAFHMPEGVNINKAGGPSFGAQLKSLRLPWLWLGWMLDPGLQHSGPSGETQRGDYFCKLLWSDGPYPSHMALMLAKKMVEQAYVRSEWNSSLPQRFEIGFGFFVNGDNLDRFAPAGEYGGRFRTFVANVFRMALLLERRNVRGTGDALRPEPQAVQVNRIARYLSENDPRPGDKPLITEILQRLSKARALR